MRLQFRNFRVESIPIWPVALVSAIGAGLFVFIALAEEVMEGERIVFDRSILLFFRHSDNLAITIGPEWVKEAAVEITALGGYPAITLLTVGVVGFLAISGRRGNAVYVLLSVIGGALLSSILKIVIDRARPDLVEQLDVIHTASFPSGHALITTVTYLTLGSLVVRQVPTMREKAYVMGAAIFVALLVGVTRVYLGVHWPSDVIAGWALGTAWAALVWCGAELAERREAIGELLRELRPSRRKDEP